MCNAEASQYCIILDIFEFLFDVIKVYAKAFSLYER